MDGELHEELLGYTAELLRRLAAHSTEDVADRFGAYALAQANNADRDDQLTSPARQTAFALVCS